MYSASFLPILVVISSSFQQKPSNQNSATSMLRRLDVPFPHEDAKPSHRSAEMETLQ